MKLIRVFVEHRLAANLGMVIMILAGVWTIAQINVGLSPVESIPWVHADIVWRGAGAEDVEKLVTTPIEHQLKSAPDVKSVRSVTKDATTQIQVEFEPDADIQGAVDSVKQRIAQLRSLPTDIEPPVIYSLRQTESVAAVLITGAGSPEELIALARTVENDLLASGLYAVEFLGLPVREIAIRVEAKTLFELGMTFEELGQRLSMLSMDAPAGVAGRGQLARQLRSLDQRRATDEFQQLPIMAADGSLLRLGDIARIELRPLVDHPRLSVAGQPAIAMYVVRDPEVDSLIAARTLTDYLDDLRPTVPEGVDLALFQEAWKVTRDQLDLVVSNGVTGLVLVIAALLLFLRLAPAFWVAMGIPATFMAALLGFYYMGGTINIISLIGLVMALGIVVDDAIVVGEETLTQLEAGRSPADAATAGASRMFAPVMAASLTTLCAFSPLAAVDQAPLKEIAIIMLVVIVASLIECFLILPGHLRHAFERGRQRRPGRARQRFDAAFVRFRERRFRPLVRLAMRNRGVTLAAAIALFSVLFLAWMTGWIKTQLNVAFALDQLEANVRFVPGLDERDKRAFLAHVEEALNDTDEALGGGNLVSHIVIDNHASVDGEPKNGPQFASLNVEMTSSDERRASADEFAAGWRDRVRRSPSLDVLSIAPKRSWFSDFSILIKGSDIDALKRASDDAMRELVTLDGVSNLRDDLPYGNDQWIIRLNIDGRALGLTSGELGRQLRAAYDGRRIQIFQQGDDELEVRLLLPEEERTNLRHIGQFPIKAPGGEMLPLGGVADLTARRGLEAIRHHDTERTLRLRGDVDLNIITGREVVSYFDANIRDRLVERYGVSTGLDELSLSEQESMGEFVLQFLVALALIYVILAWVFASWSWPLAVMSAIPLGLTGALLGHVVMGLHISPMSLLGCFTLTGIIVNDSIILLSAYKRLVAEGTPPARAIEDATCLRLRPVLLTSLTTVAGLFPLLLEQAPASAMFTPLAAAICFGLVYGTILVLIVIPVMLSLVVTGGERLDAARGRLASIGAPSAGDSSPTADAQGSGGRSPVAGGVSPGKSPR